MSFFVASDLHIYNAETFGILDEIIHGTQGIDNIILAGDISTHNYIDLVLDKMGDNYQNVIYVFGNHEYYNEDMNLINKYKKKYERSDCVHILENDNIVVDDFKIYGATLWFGELDKYEMKFKKYLNDYKYISQFKKYVHIYNKDSIKYLEENVEENSIVVTHHAPSKKCSHEKYRTSPLQCFFVNSLDKMIKKTKSEYWIYGHLHQCNDCVIGDTKLISNCCGYQFEKLGFNYDCVIK